MSSLLKNLSLVKQRILDAALRYSRPPESIMLLPVTKLQSLDNIQELIKLGISSFGENRAQESLYKIEALQEHSIEWHFIGNIQSNKVSYIANNFCWVHSIDNFKIAERLSKHRPKNMPPLNICIQVNICNETNKSGVLYDDCLDLAKEISSLSNLNLRGLMSIPVPEANFLKQREPYKKLNALSQQVQEAGFELDTLSMGMSNDLEAAIAEGATIVRIGSAIFGSRPT